MSRYEHGVATSRHTISSYRKLQTWGENPLTYTVYIYIYRVEGEQTIARTHRSPIFSVGRERKRNMERGSTGPQSNFMVSEQKNQSRSRRKEEEKRAFFSSSPMTGHSSPEGSSQKERRIGNGFEYFKNIYVIYLGRRDGVDVFATRVDQHVRQ